MKIHDLVATYHFFRQLSEIDRTPIWVVAIMLLIVMVWGVRQLYKPGVKITQWDYKWLALLLLLVLPSTHLGRISPFSDAILTSTGALATPIISFFATVPFLAALGFGGLIPAITLAVLTGALQATAMGGDWVLIPIYVCFVVVFGWFSSRTDWKDSKKPVHFPWVNVLLAFACLVPIIFFLQFVIATTYLEQDLMAVIEQSLAMIITLIPSTALSAVACQLLSTFVPDTWQPLKYIKETLTHNPISFAIGQIETLARGQYDSDINLNPRSPSEENFYHSLENLRQALQLRSEAQTRLLSLDPSYYSREGYDLVLSSILRAALGREASSARLILINQLSESTQPAMRLRIGQGDKTRDYAYLDGMIMEKVGQQNRLILTDLKVDQYFGLDPNMPYPQSIVALNLKQDNQSKGILWVGFEKNVWFSQDDIHFYEQLAYRASAVLNTKEQINRVQSDKNWLEAAINSMPEPVFILDNQYKLVFFNPQAESLIDQTYANGHDGKFSFSLPEIKALIQKSRNAGEPISLSFGKDREYHCRAYSVHIDDNTNGNLLVLKDTSSLKKLNAQKSEFFTNISHDLRSPLSLMRGYLTLLQNIGNLSEEQQKYINRIQMNIDNMSRLVSKVLSLELLDEDDPVKYITFDVKELIDETISMLELQAQQRKVSMQTNYSALKNPKLAADRVLMQQAIFNLLENAIKFSNIGGEVLVSVNRDQNWMHFSVTDHGKGIAPLDQPKLFTRFFHVKNEAGYDSRGQGLGLAIAKSVAEKHGGKIEVNSQLGEGSTFSLAIPLRKK